jgi:hypothetical protein
MLSYAAVTAARDEAANLPRLAASMLAQTPRPAAWVIVENGSTDETLHVARALASEHEWITVVQSPAGDRYDRTWPYMRAFHLGVEALAGRGDVVVKLDADVAVDPEFFAGLLAEFAADPTLGIASGACLEQHDGEWRERPILPGHAWGPTRAYRRPCLEAVLPLDDSVGYAAIDEVKAHLAGFRAATIHHLPFQHYRPEGAGEGSRWRAWHAEGAAAYWTGYGIAYLAVRCLYRATSEPAALALLAGYLGAVVRRRPRYPDPAVRAALRRRHRSKVALFARMRLARS